MQSYRKATCNLVVLTFIKKVAPAENRTRVLRSEVGALIRCAIEAWLKNLLFFVYIKLKFSFQHTSDAAQVRQNPESMGGHFFFTYFT